MAELKIDIKNLEQFREICQLVKNMIVYLPPDRSDECSQEFYRIINSLSE